MSARRRAMWVAMTSLATLLSVATLDGAPSPAPSPAPVPAPVAAPVAAAVGVPVVARSWTPAVILGAGSSVAMATSRGSTTVAWARGSFNKAGPMYTRRRIVGQSWGPTSQPASTPGTGLALAANRSNLTVAAWWQGPLRNRRLMVTRRPPGGAWQRPAVLPRRVPVQHREGVPQIAVSAGGAVAVWWGELVEGDCDRRWSFVAYSTPAGVWDAPHQLWDSSCFWSGQPDVTIEDSGTVNVAFPTRRGIRYTRRVAGRGWAAPHIIAKDFARAPRLMSTAAGNTIVVAWEGGDESVYRARRRIDGRWGPVRTTRKLPSGTSAQWDAAMDGNGSVTLGWLDEDGTITVKRWPEHGSVTGERILVEPTDKPLQQPQAEIDVAAGNRGDAVVAYFNFVRKTPGLRTVYRPPGGTWRQQPALVGPTGLADFQLAVRPAGGLEVAWLADFHKGVIRHSSLTLHGQSSSRLADTGG